MGPTKKTTRNGKAAAWTDDPTRAEKDAGHLAGMERAATAATAKQPKLIILPTLIIKRVSLRIVGDSSLICHNWSEKAKKQMLDKQMQVASAGREPRDPESDYLASFYPHPEGGHGFPTIAFKNSAVTACTSLKGTITKVAARQAFHVMGELVKLEGEPTPREDMVKNDGKVADLRYRAEFKQWACNLAIRYNSRVLSAEQILNLFNTAGFAVGVGDWRPERDGQHGLFHVEAADIQA